MASARAIARVEALIWVLVYGGLLALVLGIASLAYDHATAWVLIVCGAVVALAGAVLVWVRSRMRESTIDG